MTLNGVIALILCFFPPNLIASLVNYVTVVEDRPVMSIKYCLPIPVFQFGHNKHAELLFTYPNCKYHNLLQETNVDWYTN